MRMKIQKGIAFLIISMFCIGFLTPVIAFSNRSDGYKHELSQSLKDDKKTIRNIFRSIDLPSIKNSPRPLPFLTGTIYTTCGSIQKTTTISFGSFNKIDVDNDVTTGVDGKDIQVQYVLLPAVDIDTHLKIGLLLLLSIERIGDEIKDDYFEISAHLFDNSLILGYASPEKTQNEVPYLLQLSSFIFIKPEIGTAGVTFEINPYYDDADNKEITLFSSYTYENEKQSYNFRFEPSVHKEVTIETTNQANTIRYSFAYGAATKLIATIQKGLNSQPKETIVTIDSLPVTGSFSLGITPFRTGGGHILYESDESYQTDVIIESEEMGVCKYAFIQNLPSYFYATWDPAKNNGFLSVDIDSQGTNFQLVNSLSNPTITLMVHDIEQIGFTSYWNFTNPGDFTIHKDQSFHIDLHVLIDDWEASIDAEPTAQDIYVEWLTDITGYLSYDTNFQPLTSIDLLIKGSDLGIRTEGEYFKADDFSLEWALWPPIEFNIEKSGTIDFTALVIEIYLNGTWYHLWPWG